MTSPSWDPVSYLAFAGERERPFGELVGRVGVARPSLVVDLGCGPGTATVSLLTRWPTARVIGVDSSAAMLARAEEVADPPRLSFVLADIRDWEPPEPPDVVIANAVLQWVPGHEELIARLAARLAPGGALALQVPGNFDQPSHTLLRQLAPPGLLRDAPVLDPAGYLRLLQGAGLVADVWETTYLHVLAGPDPVLEWVRGTALRPVLDALDAGAAAELEAEYAARLRAAHPADASGMTVLPFRRVFAVGTCVGGAARGTAGAGAPAPRRAPG
ncbi:MAG: methyltransferase domain-containing protein [Acidimicrobiales bacterium]